MDKIICVGKNYLEHAKELGDIVPEKPVLFLKPPSVLVQAHHWNETIQLEFPSDDPSVHPECEIVLRMAKDGYRMTRSDTNNAFSGLTLGLDMTLRTRQADLKKQGHPWTTAKVFKNSAIIGPWIPVHQFMDFMQTSFQLYLNGNLQQHAKGQDMMMHPEDLIVYISHFFPLKAGDIIFTGTPAGVTSIAQNDTANLEWNEYAFSVQWI